MGRKAEMNNSLQETHSRFILELPAKVFCLLCGTAFISLQAKAQESVILSSLHEESLLTTLFHAVEYDATRGGKWKPDTEEQLNIQVSDDGFCYTTVDTIIYWKENKGEEETDRAAVVFATYSYFDGVRAECHACAPDLGLATLQKNQSGRWEATKFRKKLVQTGQWGTAGESSLQKLGPATSALVFSSGYMNQGYLYIHSFWYNLGTWNGLPEIFTLVEVDSGPAGCEEECNEEWCQFYHDIERKVTLLPNDDPQSDYGGYNDLLITITERTCEGVETTTNERYRFNGSRYEQICD